MINTIVPKDTKLLHQDIWRLTKVLFHHLNAYLKPAKGILLTIIVRQNHLNCQLGFPLQQSIFPLPSSITATQYVNLINTVDVDDKLKKMPDLIRRTPRAVARGEAP